MGSGSGGLWQIVLGWGPTVIWACVVVTALVLLRRPLRELLPRLEKVNVAGVDVSFVARGLDAAATEQGVPIESGRRDGAALRAEAKADLLRGSRVIWLDSRPEHNRAERRTFESLGIEVTAVTSIETATDLARRTDPDVVITNYGAPKPDGVATAVQVGHAIGAIVPVIVYSMGTWGRPTPEYCFAQTDRPDELLHFVIDALEHTKSYRQP